ncbi:MAG TPA: DinB family protein [Longimicrobiales bacterium]|nr:DinB family protein [Longimicrobiales bacterium]
MHEAQIVSSAARGGAPHLSGRPRSDEYAPYYARYVERVRPGDIAVALEEGARETVALLRSELARTNADRAYAEGKWTLKEVVGHVIDAERVFALRMMRFGRGDTTPLPSFDEDAYTPAGEFGTRTLDSLIEEFIAVRNATIHLIRGLPESAWTRRGVASGFEVSVRALAHIIAGHELHHRAILEHRYLAGD